MEKKPNIEDQNSYLSDEKSNYHLILYNDNYNTIDFVIDCLIEICEHNIDQATQCAFIAHYKGKCVVKKGSYKKLKPLKEALNEKGLNSGIE